MKAYLRSTRIAPKKARIVADMVRGMPVAEAMDLLARTQKKSARLIGELIKSAVANATHNDKQDPSQLVVRTIIVNQAAGYRRGVPMARGRVRPMTKFLSHIDLVLGIKSAESVDDAGKKTAAKSARAKSPKKGAKTASASTKTRVEKTSVPKTSKDSSESSASSESSVSSS